jgi:hypothetical protein
MSGSASGVDADLGGGLDLGGLEGVEVGAQRGHDLRRQVTPGFAAFGIGGDVAALDGEVSGQSCRGPCGPGQAERSDPGQGGPHVAADEVAAVTAELAG